jgi:pyruvate/2-oxoglutarate dehydrogenase complex dihydrolipoamide dehydrogenase (E3) component
LDEIPEHLLVIKGGYVGLKLSQAMRRFGSKVSLIDRNDRLVHGEDDDVTDALRTLFEDEGRNRSECTGQGDIGEVGAVSKNRY